VTGGPAGHLWLHPFFTLRKPRPQLQAPVVAQLGYCGSPTPHEEPV